MTRICRIAVLLLVLSVAQFCEVNSTVVRVAAWTPTGERIGNIGVVISSLSGREKYTGHGRDVKVSVPIGDYLLMVASPGFQAMWQLVATYQPEVFRSAVLPLATIEGHPASKGLTGRVRNYDGDVRSLRIRLMALYGDELWECIPDARGSFRFPADAGAYLLLIVADRDKGITLIDSQPVVIRRGEEESVAIDLKGKRGTLIPLGQR